MICQVSGRAGTAGKWRESPSRTRYAYCRHAVTVEARIESNSRPNPFWITVLAFERHYANILARISKGEMIQATGRLTRRTEPTNDGKLRETWSLRANVVTHVAR